jgi:hypothetical protein
MISSSEITTTTTTTTRVVKLAPLVGALCDPLRPTFLFGCTPPRYGTSQEEGERIARLFVDRSRVLATDGFIVYDVQDEGSRTDQERPFAFRKLMDPSWFASVLTRLSGKECVVYKAATCCESPAAFSQWVDECAEAHGHSAINVVGAPSSSYVSNGPSVRAAAKIVRDGKRVRFGCVAIAERHTKKACEHSIMLKKASWGAEWFITQGIFDAAPMVALLNDYAALCAAEGVAPKKVILTFTPCGRKKTMQFVKWLGMNVPSAIEARIFAPPPAAAAAAADSAPAPAAVSAGAGAEAAAPPQPAKKKKKKAPKIKTAVEISCDVMCENLRAILDGVRGQAGAAVPLGINVESVSGYRDEIDATHVLFRDLQVRFALTATSAVVALRRRARLLVRNRVSPSSPAASYSPSSSLFSSFRLRLRLLPLRLFLACARQQAIMLDDFTAKSGTHWAVRWYPCEPQRAQARERSDSHAPRALASLGSADVCRLALALELGAFVDALRREQLVGEDLADADFTIASLDEILEGRAVLKKRFMRRLGELRANGVPLELL